MLSALDPRIYIVAAALFVLTAFGSYIAGRSDGKDIERVEWQKEKLSLLRGTQQLMQAQLIENAGELDKQRKLTKRTSDEYEIKIASLDAKYAAARNGGLRLPTTACSRYDDAKATATSAGKLDEAAAFNIVSDATTERIPAVIEDRLFALAKNADQLSEQLSALQKWIRESGLY